MKRIIFAGTPEIAAGVLQTLIAAKFQIIACLTQPDRPQGRGLKLCPSAVKVCAQQNNILVLQPTSLKQAAIQQQLIDLKPDLMIVMAYGLILPPAILNTPTLGCINIHASILPRWRGAAPIQYAILSGDAESGISIMQMDAGLDTGDVLATYPCPVNSTDTSQDLYIRLELLAQTGCIEALRKLQAGELTPVKQSEVTATYAHKIDKQQAKINWHSSSVEIERCIRAYNPWPIAFTTFMGESVRIWSAAIVEAASSKPIAIPGTILSIDKQGIVVETGNGVLRILTMQFPGKKILPSSDICHANKNLKVGAQFG